MRRKRFKHTAFIICHMFCGWRLVNSTKEFNKLGSGIFKYDLLSKKASFNGEIIDNPNICYELDGFLLDEMNRLSLDYSVFKSVILNVDIEQIIIESYKRKTNDIHFDKDKKVLIKGIFYQYKLKCLCTITTEDGEYIGKYNDVEEWPDNWP